MIYAYFKELYYRSCLVFFSWCFLICICFLYREMLVFLIILPIFKLSKNLFFYLIYTNIAELLNIYINTALLIGNFVTILYILFHVISFIHSGLYFSEIRLLKTVLYSLISTVSLSYSLVNLLIIPILYFYFEILQKSAAQKYLNFQLETRIDEYLFFYMGLVKVLCFFLLIYLFICVYLNYLIKKSHNIKVIRRYTYFSFFVCSTIFSPPELIYQLFFGIVFSFLFEQIILVTFFQISIKTLNTVKNF